MQALPTIILFGSACRIVLWSYSEADSEKKVHSKRIYDQSTI
jgi:hypothetical protein